MNLRDKKYFYFTQNSLNTFKTCPFRFKKKYIDNVKWQQDESDLATERIEFGLDFHKIAERYFKNIPIYEESFMDNEELYKAYKNLISKFPSNGKNQYYPEYAIRFSNGMMRVESNIDLIIVKDDGAVEIWDWKTNADVKNAKKYEMSLQTSVYMWTVKKCFKDILGVDVSAEKIKMIYFCPEKNQDIVEMLYSEEKFRKDEKTICDLINDIYEYDYNDFDKSKYIKQCKFCEFSMFCNSEISSEVVEFKKWNLDEIEEVIL